MAGSISVILSLILILTTIAKIIMITKHIDVINKRKFTFKPRINPKPPAI